MIIEKKWDGKTDTKNKKKKGGEVF